MLAEISPSADPSTRTVLVKVDLPNQPGVRMGMFGRLELSTEKRSAIAIPRSALVRRGQLELVFVAKAGRAELRLVRSGRVRANDIEISSGLDPDELVVVTNAEQLRDAQPIEVGP
jgi:multidrug efflux pump subunit AcrA (membrane-fusion protein)